MTRHLVVSSVPVTAHDSSRQIESARLLETPVWLGLVVVLLGALVADSAACALLDDVQRFELLQPCTGWCQERGLGLERAEMRCGSLWCVCEQPSAEDGAP